MIDRTPITVSALIRWLNAFIRDRQSQQVSRNTIKFYSVEFRRFIAFCEESSIVDVEQLTADTLRSYFIHLADEGRNSGGIDAAWRALKTFLRWYEAENEPDGWKNPYNKLKRGRVDDNPVPPVDIKTVRKMFQASKGQDFFSCRDRAIILFLLDTGIRAFELCNLNVQDVDDIAGQAIVSHGKGGKWRAIAFGQKTARAMRAYSRLRPREAEAYWSREDGGRLTYSGLRQILRRLAAQAGVREPGIHSFRRACSLALTKEGVPLLINQKQMGHSDPKVTARYNRLDIDDLIETYAKASPVDNWF